MFLNFNSCSQLQSVSFHFCGLFYMHNEFERIWEDYLITPRLIWIWTLSYVAWWFIGLEYNLQAIWTKSYGCQKNIWRVFIFKKRFTYLLILQWKYLLIPIKILSIRKLFKFRIICKDKVVFRGTFICMCICPLVKLHHRTSLQFTSLYCHYHQIQAKKALVVYLHVSKFMSVWRPSSEGCCDFILHWSFKQVFMF